MDTIIIAYWTQTGNTKAMAEAVGEGVEIAGKKADVRHISEVSMDSLREAQVFAMGCPAMGAEVLEEGEMEPFVMEVEGFAQGKRIGLFGSYGWGDGQWMRDWEERMKAAGAVCWCQVRNKKYSGLSNPPREITHFPAMLQTHHQTSI